jgi:hypothetical protein
MKLRVEKGLKFGTSEFSIMTTLHLTKRYLLNSFWPKKSITEMENPSYSPDFALNDCWLLPGIKYTLKERIFQDTENIKK